jgi:hypothetical protein
VDEFEWTGRFDRRASGRRARPILRCRRCGADVVHAAGTLTHHLKVCRGAQRLTNPFFAEDAAYLEAAERARDTRRCPMCGGLNPGDATHSRCWSGR